MRHCVKHADYPAVIPVQESLVIGRSLHPQQDGAGASMDWNEATVRGTLVAGLTHLDILALDAFEGEVSQFRLDCLSLSLSLSLSLC